MHSGGVTDLQTLRVAQLQIDGQWKSRGNTGTSGSAGAAGSVISESVIPFDQREKLFTLASSVSNENILPRNEILFTGRKEGRAVRFEARTISDLSVDAVVLEAATDNLNFRRVNRSLVPSAENRLNFIYHPTIGEKYFRMHVLLNGGSSFISRVVYVNAEEDSRLNGNVRVDNEQLLLRWHSEKTEELKIYLHDMTGRLLRSKMERVKPGPNTISFQRLTLSKGMHILSVVSKDGRSVMKIMIQ